MSDWKLTLRACAAALAALAAGWLFLQVPATAQDAPPADEAAAADRAEEDVEDVEDDYDPADEIFAPSEKIRADSEISFPSDI